MTFPLLCSFTGYSQSSLAFIVRSLAGAVSHIVSRPQNRFPVFGHESRLARDQRVQFVFSADVELADSVSAACGAGLGILGDVTAFRVFGVHAALPIKLVLNDHVAGDYVVAAEWARPEA